ncbi:MAG TPA: phosphoribosylformylglycinamidine synthase subunit PurL [Bacteroidota bacterium]|nr:phosphoribosylformylglycinamidine synthase subunit PurL [Bacteroidota bacterium]
MPEPEVTLELARSHGLTDEEYGRILSILGRTPTYTELGIYSVMWSEHCSYKNSIARLKTLPRSGGRLLVAGGEENAGLVDIGDGLAVAFKIESHNHPSAVEPYQGAATGVGGILRDIFSMGARPIAALNSLRFGELTDERTRYLMKRVVKGIADYGNSFGVPTVAGEVYFDKCYARNPLVNAMAVGIVEKDKIARATAYGAGNSVMIVGSSTGRDGIHGATFASEEISEDSDRRRPSVQVGDPFVEKLLLEATLEAIASGYVVGVQDMGAAGITCSTTEMAAKGESGMSIDLDLVPLRETGMTAYEIMLSESQERMLFIVKDGHQKDVVSIFQRWDLHAEVIGNVDRSNRVRVFVSGRSVAEVPASTLVLGGGAPVYEREARQPEYIKRLEAFDVESVQEPKDLKEPLLELLRRPTIASKRWIYEQYDSMVRTNTQRLSGDAAVVRIKGTSKGLALTTDCNARYVYLNPRRGAMIAVAEAARNVACVGARPIAITNCLNFGNPYDPEIFWQFSEAVEGIGEACRVLETPVTGGNVSFYNESPDGPIYPTPVIGMLGFLEDVDRSCGMGFIKEGDSIVLLGENRGEVGASEYLLMRTGAIGGPVPALDIQREKNLHRLLEELIRGQNVNSAHDVSEGGLAVCLAECIIHAESQIGANMYSRNEAIKRQDFELFGETQSLVVVSATPRNAELILRESKAAGVPSSVIGTVTMDANFRFSGDLEVTRREMERAYYCAVEDGVSGR